MDRVYRLGAPDYAMRRYSADPVEMWAEVARQCRRYGLDGIQMGTFISTADGTVFRQMLEGFQRTGNNFKPQLMISPWGSKEQFVAFFDHMAEELAPPNLYRLNGRPVIVLYQDRAVNTTPPRTRC